MNAPHINHCCISDHMTVFLHFVCCIYALFPVPSCSFLAGIRTDENGVPELEENFDEALKKANASLNPTKVSNLFQVYILGGCPVPETNYSHVSLCNKLHSSSSIWVSKHQTNDSSAICSVCTSHTCHHTPFLNAVQCYRKLVMTCKGDAQGNSLAKLEENERTE